jgi:hypothetical protein
LRKRNREATEDKTRAPENGAFFIFAGYGEGKFSIAG